MNSVIHPPQDGLLDSDLLARYQDTWETMQVFSKLLGFSTYILQGVEEAGSVVSNGWVVRNGELLPFVGGAIGTTCEIKQEVVEVVSNELTLEQVNRWVAFGNGGQSFPYSDLTKNRVQQRHRIAEFDIGEWNMQALGGKNIDIGIAGANVRSVEVLIYSDSGTNVAPIDFHFSGETAGTWQQNGTEIELTRESSGIFNNPSWSGSGNRGKVVVKYVNA